MAKRLTESDLTSAMRSVICAMFDGGQLLTGGGRRWLTTGFQSGVAASTFFGLLRRGLIRPSLRTSIKHPQNRWILTGKGREWARRDWTPRLRRAA